MNWLILDAVYLWRKQYTNKPGLYWVYGTILITSSALLHSYLSVRSNPFIVYQETGSGIFSVLYINGFIRGLYHLALSFVAFDIGQQEHYVYSIVWLVIAAGLIVFGQSSNKTLINKIGFSILVLVVLKALIIDLSNLDGLYRALSFIGLGLCLVAIGWLFQRFKSKAALKPAVSG
jgi:uncharacterized membrane protein